MSSEKTHKKKNSLALRLALLHATVFGVASSLAFLIFYLVLASQIQHRTDTALLEQVRECATLLRTQGIQSVKTEIGNAAEAAGTHDLFFRLLGETGQEIASSDASGWKSISYDTNEIRNAVAGIPVIQTRNVPGQGNVRVIYSMLGPGTILQIAQSLRDDERLMSYLQLIFGVALAVMSLVAVLIGWLTANRALSKVRAVTQTAIEISSGAISRRVPAEQRTDEIGQLAGAFNTMLDRIESLMGGMREVTDNLAHELRSPVARMRGIAEAALTGAHTEDELKNVAGITVENCDHLLNLINTTLDVSEAEAGVASLKKSQVSLKPMLSDICELFRYVAEEKNVALEVNLPNDCSVQGDISKLQRCVSNLVDNALKYTPPKGTVKVTLSNGGADAIISIADSGCGIREDDLSKIFQRFYRCDESRSTRGNGLGLSLARALVRAHGGEIYVKSSVGQGSTFTIKLPMSNPSATGLN